MKEPELHEPHDPVAQQPQPNQGTLNVLLVEDVENDAELVRYNLQKAGLNVLCERVDTEASLNAALSGRKWDVVIADYRMPHYDGISALGLVRSKGLDVPFIIVSGYITDDAAVAAMKAGANDYVMKDNLMRLGPAITRELREAGERRERRRGEERLKIEHAFRRAIENSVPAGIATVDLEGRQTYVNPAFCRMVGWSDDELLGAKPPFLYWPPEEVETITQTLRRFLEDSACPDAAELRFRRRNGERFHVLLQLTPLKDSLGNVTGYVGAVSDISERKEAEMRLAAEHAITRILANAQNLAEAAPAMLRVLLDCLGVEFGALWVVDPGRQALLPQVMDLRDPSPGLKKFLHESRRLSFAPGSGLPGSVWQSRKPAWHEDLSQSNNFERRELALRAGLRSIAAFPIQNAGHFFGLLEFLSAQAMEQRQATLNMMSAIGSEIAQFIRRRTAEEALRRAHDELELRVRQRTDELNTANARLKSSIAERKRLEHELLDITEKERRRIGLDLHDDLGQKLSGIALMTKGLQRQLEKIGLEQAGDAARIHDLVHEAMNHASDLAHDLATMDPKDKDLRVALEELAARARELFGITCSFKTKGALPLLEAPVTMQLHKIAQEALTNAIKHGKARRVSITIENHPAELVLTVHNTGLPFPDLEGRPTGMGLRIMNYRASLIGARLEITGAAKGTRVRCTLPLGEKSTP